MKARSASDPAARWIVVFRHWLSPMLWIRFVPWIGPGPRFDVVVSDGHLPDGLGPMVLDRVRSRGRDGNRADARMFGMTASLDGDLRRAFFDAGAGLVMTKPVALTTLRAVVD